MRKVHKELTRSFMAYKAAQRYGGVPASRRRQKKKNTTTSTLTEEMPSATTDIASSSEGRPVSNDDDNDDDREEDSKDGHDGDDDNGGDNRTPPAAAVSSNESALHQALSSKASQEASEFVGCLPVGFQFNAPRDYQKVNTPPLSLSLSPSLPPTFRD